MNLPVLTYSVTGTEITTNFEQSIKEMNEIAMTEIERELTTDQDFADKELFIKDVKKARVKLKASLEDIKGQFESFAITSDYADQLDKIMLRMESAGTKQIKEAKQAKKDAIFEKAEKALDDFIEQTNDIIEPMNLHNIKVFSGDWAGVSKGKSNFDSIVKSVDIEFERIKSEINELVLIILPNLDFLRRKAANHRFLFRDAEQIIAQPKESFEMVVTGRIAKHNADIVAAEAKRIAEEQQAKVIAETVKEQFNDHITDVGNMVHEPLPEVHAPELVEISLDQQHLKWIFNRMVEIHGEKSNYDYMIKFQSIINNMKG